MPNAVVTPARASDAMPSGRADRLGASVREAERARHFIGLRSSTASFVLALRVAGCVVEASDTKLDPFHNLAEVSARKTALPVPPPDRWWTGFIQGVQLVSKLPADCALGTVYTAAIARTARNPDLAHTFISLLADVSSARDRAESGFE
jgi:hypothetical protein